jgi:hypothetical protein
MTYKIVETLMSFEEAENYKFGPVLVGEEVSHIKGVRTSSERLHWYLDDEVIDWCRDNLYGKIRCLSSRERRIAAYFTDEKDAIHFKLRWS